MSQSFSRKPLCAAKNFLTRYQHKLPQRSALSLSLGLLSIAILILTGCSTIDSRIEKNSSVFQSLSPTDQALVRAGKIREGMPKSAIFIAWGKPDHTRSGVKNGRLFETWTYTALQSQYTPGYYSPMYGPYLGWGGWGGYGWGWGGYPYYSPWGGFYDNWTETEVPYKKAFFEGDRCTGYEYIH